jgi:NTP pyrophosphatase (non-canonical NTP hydrolase)
MLLSEYQAEALKTADDEAFDLEYLVPMIVGETGELFGQRAKAHWHKWDAAKLEDLMVKEAGDIAWGTAILLHVKGISGINIPNHKGHIHYPDGNDLSQALLNRAADIHLFYSQPHTHRYLADEAQLLWKTLKRYCESPKHLGVDFDTVLQANLDKLRSRAERGVLKGAGDLR